MLANINIIMAVTTHVKFLPLGNMLSRSRCHSQCFFVSFSASSPSPFLSLSVSVSPWARLPASCTWPIPAPSSNQLITVSIRAQASPPFITSKSNSNSQQLTAPYLWVISSVVFPLMLLVTVVSAFLVRLYSLWIRPSHYLPPSLAIFPTPPALSLHCLNSAPRTQPASASLLWTPFSLDPVLIHN